MKLLVTGANGFVGQALCCEAIARGIEVRGATRQSCALPAGVEPVVLDLEDANWTQALQGVDAVIHLAARVHVMQDDSTDPVAEFRRVNVAGTAHLARVAAAAGVQRFVFVSSIKVNGEATDGIRRFSASDTPDPRDNYGVSKWEAEQALHSIAAETGLEIVIGRPPLVYGAGVKGNFAQMLNVLARGIPLPLATVKNRRSLIYLGNFVDALILCAMHPAASGQTYLLSDGEDISTSDLLRQLTQGMGCPARLFHCPQALLKLAGRLTNRTEQIERLLGSLQVDSNKIRRELGWTPPYTLEQGLQITTKKQPEN